MMVPAPALGILEIAAATTQIRTGLDLEIWRALTRSY